jgi:predicted ester cyclase
MLAAVTPVAAQYTRKSNEQTEKQNLETVRRMTEKMNRGEWRAAADDFAEDTQNHGAKVGREGVRAVLEDIFTTFPDMRMEILESLASGEWVSVRYRVTGTHRGVGKIPVNGGLLVGVAPTGKRFAVEHIHQFKLRGGKVIDHYATRDDLGMMQQLGLLPLTLSAK